MIVVVSDDVCVRIGKSTVAKSDIEVVSDTDGTRVGIRIVAASVTTVVSCPVG